MGNIPDYSKVIGDLIRKGRERDKSKAKVEMTCQHCLKRFPRRNPLHQSSTTFTIRKGWKQWFFCSYECQLEFRKAGLYGPIKQS